MLENLQYTSKIQPVHQLSITFMRMHFQCWPILARPVSRYIWRRFYSRLRVAVTRFTFFGEYHSVEDAHTHTHTHIYTHTHTHTVTWAEVYAEAYTYTLNCTYSMLSKKTICSLISDRSADTTTHTHTHPGIKQQPRTRS